MKKLTDADRSQWRNIWCILRSLDWWDFDESVRDQVNWKSFLPDPHGYVIRTDDRQADAIWRAVEKRLKTPKEKT